MIRTYKVDDKDEVMALLKLNIPTYFHESEESDFKEYLDQEVEVYFVVEKDEGIVAAGGINYFPGKSEARISWDIVHPKYQGKGIGKALTLHRIDILRKNPSVKVIYVRTTQLVYPFYEKVGFVLERTEKDFWADGFDLYQMRMALK